MHYETIRQALPRATFVDFTSQMQELRLIKSYAVHFTSCNFSTVQPHKYMV
jgi:hypothetical protein